MEHIRNQRRKSVWVFDQRRWNCTDVSSFKEGDKIENLHCRGGDLGLGIA